MSKQTISGGFSIVLDVDKLADVIAEKVVGRLGDEDLREAKPTAHVQNSDWEGSPVGQRRPEAES